MFLRYSERFNPNISKIASIVIVKVYHVYH